MPVAEDNPAACNHCGSCVKASSQTFRVLRSNIIAAYSNRDYSVGSKTWVSRKNRELCTQISYSGHCRNARDKCFSLVGGDLWGVCSICRPINLYRGNLQPAIWALYRHVRRRNSRCWPLRKCRRVQTCTFLVWWSCLVINKSTSNSTSACAGCSWGFCAPSQGCVFSFREKCPRFRPNSFHSPEAAITAVRLFRRWQLSKPGLSPREKRYLISYRSFTDHDPTCDHSKSLSRRETCHQRKACRSRCSIRTETDRWL